MRTRKLLLMAMTAMLTAGLVSCGKDDENGNGSGNGGNNGGGVVTDTTGGGNPDPAAWVDLGLPSGLLWATCNLGATSPEGYGDYYAWGETTTKSTYNWSNYKYCMGDDHNLTKYCSMGSYGYNGFTDNLTVLEAMDDAATQALGSGARMPTADEWRELINNTTSAWTTQNGVNGRKFTASNGKSLFLPAAGRRWDGGLDCAGSDGYYWSSSLSTDLPDYAWGFYFSSGGQYVDYDYRYYGLAVRAVRQN